jgi:hypothetical protein
MNPHNKQQDQQGGKGAPITKKEQVQHNPDPKIDQDYQDFPHAPAKPELINPKTKADKETADLGKVDGDKVNDTANEDGEDGDDEQRSDGSGGAFASTEEVSDEYDVFDYELRELK